MFFMLMFSKKATVEWKTIQNFIFIVDIMDSQIKTLIHFVLEGGSVGYYSEFIFFHYCYPNLQWDFILKHNVELLNGTLFEPLLKHKH